ncbi:MAG: RNase P subunit p30 family protein [Candidatus Nanosalina sp.]
MESIPDLCIREESREVVRKAEEIGWADPDSYETVFLKAEDWGELKKEIQRERENCDVLVFCGGDEELNRKSVEDGRIDVLLHPEKGRKDSGVDQVIAEKASENSVAIGLDFRQLSAPPKKQMHILSHWRKNLKLCEKYGTPYLITTCAEEKHDLRAPRDLESFIDSIGYNGEKTLETHQDILERNRKILEPDTGSKEVKDA